MHKAKQPLQILPDQTALALTSLGVLYVGDTEKVVFQTNHHCFNLHFYHIISK
jgi:hypothetical protein